MSPTSEVLATHIFYCFSVLEAKLNGLPSPSVPFVTNGDEQFPLFVTWDKYSQIPTVSSHVGEASLRGCIGNFKSMPLAEGLRKYALIAALEDTRFNPISAKELPYLRCSVSLLTPFVPLPDPLAWTIGLHGIYITLPAPHSSYSATYLPFVAPSQGWNKVETILSLIKKSGYPGWKRVKEGDEVWNGLKVMCYESLVYQSEGQVEHGEEGLAWADYEKWKESRV